jgi:hypothetical protein
LILIFYLTKLPDLIGQSTALFSSSLARSCKEGGTKERSTQCSLRI